MGRTYNQRPTKYDDERPSGRTGKHPKHSIGKKSRGMKNIENHLLDEDDYLDDEVEVRDIIEINITRETSRS